MRRQVFSFLNARPERIPRVMRAAVDHPYDVLKPFLWIAALGFVSGFLGYVGLHGGLPV